MITPIDDAELAELIAELHRERFGAIPWIEKYRQPRPLGVDTPAEIERRRRILCASLNGEYREDLPVTSTAA